MRISKKGETDNMDERRNWQALQAFYRLKSLLLPSFIQRNKRALNILEANLMREHEEGGGEK